MVPRTLWLSLVLPFVLFRRCGFWPPTSWVGIVINFISGFAWGGYNLAAFNLLLELTPDENRSMYIGAYNTFMGIATSVGPVLGGFTAEFFGLRSIFLVSFAVRAFGLFPL